MTSAAGAIVLRPPAPSDSDAIQTVLEASTYEDDPVGFARGGWANHAWASETRILLVADRLVGFAAVRAEPAADGAMPARIALDPRARQPSLAAMLVHSALDLVRQIDGTRVRLFLPDRAAWAEAAVQAAGFVRVRTIAHMLLASTTSVPVPPPVAGVTLRSIAPGEDERVLAALNHAWQGTWNFVSITPEMLANDLAGQREGMLLGIADADGQIAATCHAMFEVEDDGADGAPHAWISNLTVTPAFRKRGLARAMLVAGIAYLRARSAGSITLGVDADDPAPYTLYQSVGFEVIRRINAWDKYLSPP